MKLLILLACVTAAAARVARVPLEQIETRRIRLIRDGKWEEHQRVKETLRMEKMKSKESLYHFTGNQGVNDYDDLEYVGNVTIGTPATQVFTVVLDTGSSNFWIPDSSCMNSICKSKHRYNSSQSSTYSKYDGRWHAQYGEKSVANGFYGVDTVTFKGESSSQLRITNQVFGQATLVHGFDNSPIDGILGLGFTYLADNFITPPVINAIAQGLFAEPIFTVWMQHKGDHENANAGEFTYGSFNHEHCEPVIAYQPLSMAAYWQFRMKAVGVGNYLNRKGWDVITDTATSFIGGPQYVLEQIAVVLGATYNSSVGAYVIPCESVGKLMNIAFYFGGHRYEVEPANYAVKLGKSICTIGMLNFEFGGYGPSWVLGDPFIRQYCLVHDVGQQRIGFARNKRVQI